MSNFTQLTQYKNGKDVEAFLDGYFRQRGYQIRQTTDHEERVLCLGDRQFTWKDTSLFIEYKSGIQTFYTGNIFIETISVDDPNNYKLGWVYTCKADILIYATILNNCLLLFRPDGLRQIIDKLKLRYKEVSTSHNQNNGYNTYGLIIPFKWARENLAHKVISLLEE